MCSYNCRRKALSEIVHKLHLQYIVLLPASYFTGGDNTATPWRQSLVCSPR